MRLVDVEPIIKKLQDDYHGMISDESMKIYKIIQMLNDAPTVQKCNVLKLRKEMFPLLFSKKKTSTCRQGFRYVDVNKELKFVMTEDESFSIDVFVTDVKHIKYRDLTEEEAIKEGYSSLKELQTVLEKIYTVNDDDDFTIIEFAM